MPDPYRYFRIEAREIVEQLGQGALDLEKAAAGETAAVVARLLRLAHTLKGAARVVKLPTIAELAHSLEDLLVGHRDRDVAVPRERIDQVLAITDDVAQHVAALSPPEPAASQPQAVVTAAPDAPPAAPRPHMDDLDALLNRVLETQARLGELRPHIAALDRARSLSSLAMDQLKTRTVSQPGAAGAVEKARSIIDEVRAACASIEGAMTAGVDQLDRELQQVREAAEWLRLLPVSSLFTFLERTVRDTSVALGRQVRFDASGGDVRADPVALNTVRGALQHIVRNAVTHGIESDAERRQAGKPREGVVSLRVSQRGHWLSFVCADDGRGIDLAAVRRVAVTRGIAKDEHALDTDALLQLLLKGGISTAPSVTEVAGRGIGLDVVREAAETLHGHATVSTGPTGTTFTINVPLSVASFQALIVDVSGIEVGIPLDTVVGSRHVKSSEVVHARGRLSLLIDGETIPLAPWPDPAGRESQRDTAASTAVVVRGADRLAAFAVTGISGVRNVVMRPLPAYAIASPLIAGAALDAVGDPFLIFDARELARAELPVDAPAPPPAPSLPILVIDDSLTTRMLEQSILESAGYAVELATSAEEGLEKAAHTRYALFLVDVEMPGMDGFSFVERIRATPTLRDVPAILVTSRNASEDRQRGLDAGAQAYIVKSEFDQTLLLERIRSLIN